MLLLASDVPHLGRRRVRAARSRSKPQHRAAGNSPAAGLQFAFCAFFLCSAS